MNVSTDDYQGVESRSSRGGGRASLHKSLVVFGAALGLSGGFAPVYFGTLSVFLKPIGAEFAWGRAETAATGVFSMIGLAIGAILMGRLSDRFGPARVITSSVFAMSILIFLLSTGGGNPLVFGGLSFAIGMAGAATTPPGYLGVLAQNFDRRLGLALGLAGVGMGAGTVLMPLLAQWQIGLNGWRGAYANMAIGSGMLGCVACIAIFVRSSAQRAAQDGERSEAEVRPGMSVGEAIRGYRFWLLALVVFTVSAASLGVAIHLVALITDRGVSAAQAASVSAISGVGVVAGRLVCGLLLDRYFAPRIASVAFVLAAIGVAALAAKLGGMLWLVSTSALFVGFAIGAEGDFLPYFVRRYFGLRAFGSIYGLIFFSFGIGGVVGPILFGLCYDRLGEYDPALWTAAVALGASGVSILMLRGYRYGVPSR